MQTIISFNMSRLFKLFIIGVLLSITSNIPGAFAQSSMKLFEIDHLTKAKKSFKSHELDRTYVAVNQEITQKGSLNTDDILFFKLDNEHVEMRVNRALSYRDGTYSISASNEQTGDILIITFENHDVAGKLHLLSRNSLYHFSKDTERNQTYLARIDHTQLDKIHDCLIEEPESFYGSEESDISGSFHSPNMASMIETIDDELTIDLMIPYTKKAKQWADSSEFGSINTVIAQAMNLSQAALDNSDVHINLRLVHSFLTDYEDDGGGDVSGGEHLRRLTASPAFNPFGGEFNGYMDEVHTLRDAYGADLVALFASEPNTSGVAWRLNNIEGRPNYGFSVNRVEQMAIGYTLIHEIGHNMGNVHARNQNSASATDLGGIFQYSVGYRWESEEESFTTVMGYPENVYLRIPLFSSPDLTWENTAAGSDDPAGPANSALSMEQTKRVIASYRPTMIDPPQIVLAEDNIQINMDIGDQVNVPFLLSNQGSSDLVWNIDFEPVAFDPPASEKPDPSEESKYTKSNEYHLQYSTFHAAGQNENLVYSTTFSEEEGFVAGDYAAFQSWTTSDTSYSFEIRTVNPTVGTNHARLAQTFGYEDELELRSPYFGPQPFGNYAFEMDIYIGETDGKTNEQFDINLYDGNSGDISAGIRFNSDGNIATLRRLFFSTGIPYETGVYKPLKIVFNTDEKVIEYYYDNEVLSKNPFTNANKLDFFRVIHYNQVEGSFIDIDNVKIIRTGSPFTFLTVDRFGGSVEPGQEKELNFTFSSEEIPEGMYQMNMILSTNDPDKMSKTIPVTMNVTDPLSVENGQSQPVRLELAQNYPNPFNPTTEIRYTMPSGGHVNLSVFDVLGRHVTTLVDGVYPAGSHKVQLDASDLSSGIYIYRLETGNEVLSNKMILIK